MRAARIVAAMKAHAWVIARVAAGILSASALALFARDIARSQQPGASGAPTAGLQQCSGRFPGTVVVTFRWASSNDGPQWLDLSLADNGFAPNTFVSVGPLDSGVAQFAWDGILGDRTQFVRVNTLTSQGWQPSATASFISGVCAGPTPAQIGDVTQSCGGATLGGSFRWAVAQPAGQVQWLDLSTQDNGFVPGTFVSAGPLDGSATSFYWAGLLQGATHFWRVNTWTGASWVTSSTGSIVTGYCQGAPPPLPLPLPLPIPGPTNYAEWVSVYSVFSDSGDKVIVFRADGEEWLLDYGVGCIELDLYEGRSVLVTSPSVFFAGIGSHIVIPDADESCIIWDSTQIG